MTFCGKCGSVIDLELWSKNGRKSPKKPSVCWDCKKEAETKRGLGNMNHHTIIFINTLKERRKLA